jgi:hypothetical protein
VFLGVVDGRRGLARAQAEGHVGEMQAQASPRTNYLEFLTVTLRPPSR